MRRWVAVTFILTLITVACTNEELLQLRRAQLDSIKEAIRKKGAKWQASMTPVFLLSDEARKNLLGEISLFPSDTPPEWVPQRIHFVLPSTTSSFDWRNHSGRDWTTPVRDQDTCGSCWAFATVGSFEACINIYADSAEFDPDLSEQQLVSCDTMFGGCSGGSFAGRYLVNTGLFDDSCMPYVAYDQPCTSRCSDWQSRIKFKALAYYNVTGGADSAGIENIKEAVLTHPVYSSMRVYSDFLSYSGGVYEHVAGSYLGSHAVVIVGFNDTDSAWICKNSWDTTWGESGWFRIKYGNCGIGTYCRVIVPATRVEINSEYNQVYPYLGTYFIGFDSTLEFYAVSPVMGGGDTVFAFDCWNVSGKDDSTIDTTDVSLTIDFPTTITAQWDTVTGVPKVDVTLLTDPDGLTIKFARIPYTGDTTITWMAESTVTITTDSTQWIEVSDVVMRRYYFTGWDPDSPRTFSYELSDTSGADTFSASFSTDSTKFLLTFDSTPIKCEFIFSAAPITDPTITAPVSFWSDSGYSFFVSAENKNLIDSSWRFTHWEDSCTANLRTINTTGPDTFVAVLEKFFRFDVRNGGHGTVGVGSNVVDNLWVHEDSVGTLWVDSTLVRTSELYGFIFNGFVGTHPTSACTLTVTMDGPVYDTASWDSAAHIIAYSEHGTTWGTGWYVIDSIAVIGAQDTVVEGVDTFVFAGWSGITFSTANPCTLVVDSGGTAFAVWDTVYLALRDSLGLKPRKEFLVFVSPNPFNSTVKIESDVGCEGLVVDVFDVLGKKVVTLAESNPKCERCVVTWSPSKSLPSGVYIADVHLPENPSIRQRKILIYLK